MQSIVWPGTISIFSQGNGSLPSILGCINSFLAPAQIALSKTKLTSKGAPAHSTHIFDGPAGKVLSSSSITAIRNQSPHLPSYNASSKAGSQPPHLTSSILYPFVRPSIRPPTFLSPFTSTSRLYSTYQRPTSTSPLFNLNAIQRRNFSLLGKKDPMLSLNTSIALLEAAAKNDPANVPKQVAYLRGLVEYGGEAGAERVITLWERWSELDPTTPVLREDEAFKVYCESLLITKQTTSVVPAVHRRESILAAHPLAEAASTPVVKTGSQLIADEVLSNPKFHIEPAPKGWRKLFPGRRTNEVSQGITAGQPIRVVVEESKRATLWKIVRSVLAALFFGFLILTISAMFLDQLNVAKLKPTTKQWEASGGKVVKFEDVHGVDEAKYDLQEIVDFLKNPNMFTALGGKLPKGVLLTGPPGTGKTMLAKAVAGEAGVPFFFASGSEFDEIYVGSGSKKVRELFAAARAKQPAIVFIDELDAVGGKRSSRDHQYMRQTLNQLLVELDGFKESEGIIVIAATNFPESLDPALVRPGRFDKKVVVPLPDIRGRTEILKSYMKDVRYDINVDATVIARGTPGFSGADLQNLVNLAAIQASKEQAPAVLPKHFEWAIDRIVMGAERKSAKITEEDKLHTAYHEIGHTMLSLYTDGSLPLHKVTCIPRGRSLGVTKSLPERDTVSVTFKEYMAYIDVAMGGRAAEEVVYGKNNISSGASSDIQKATQIARSMITRWGFSDVIGPVFMGEEISPQKQNEIDAEVRRILEASSRRAVNLLEEKRDELDLLAKALAEYETLTAEEVRKLVKGEPIRDPLDPIPITEPRGEVPVLEH